ncbi:MAG TPA: transposase [Actinoplanes sp.]|nr:transposase [Actinoplanes sp.]
MTSVPATSGWRPTSPAAPARERAPSRSRGEAECPATTDLENVAAWPAQRMSDATGAAPVSPCAPAGRTSTNQHRQILGLLRRHRYRLWRTWELTEQLRNLSGTTDPACLNRWCAGERSRIPAFRNVVRGIEEHADAIAAAAELGLSHSRLEGINAKIRLSQRRGFGFYLYLGGVAL